MVVDGATEVGDWIDADVREGDDEGCESGDADTDVMEAAGAGVVG